MTTATPLNGARAPYPYTDLIAQRRDKDDAFRLPQYSPLTARQQAVFDGLRYFPANAALSFDLTPHLFSPAEQTMQRIMTSTNEIRHYQRWAQLSFTVEGESIALTLYRDPLQDGFFLPFTDATSGHDTYAAGRYVEVETLAGSPEVADGQWRLRLDFNGAYNPYCAYNARWSCPYVPNENHLAVPIRAGEMTPADSWASHD